MIGQSTGVIGAECRYRYQQYAGVVGAGLRCSGGPIEV